MRVRELGMAALMFAGAGGCATRPQAKAGPRLVAAAPNAPAAAVVSPQTTSEQIEEIDLFFRRTAGHLQYRCYNEAVEQTHKKYEGTVTVQLMVLPGGRAGSVKIVKSTLVSTDKSKTPATEIVSCVLENVKGWSWPAVNSPQPYIGAISFKPAW